MRMVGTLKRLLVAVAIALPTALAMFAAGSLVASHAAQAAAVTPIPVPGAARGLPAAADGITRNDQRRS